MITEYSGLVLRKRFLERTINQIKREKDQSSNGCLIISGGRYYHKKTINGVEKREHISLKNKELIQELAQNSYNKNLLRDLEKELGVISTTLDKVKHIEKGRHYKDLSDVRKQLVIPKELDDEEYARRWEMAKYKTNNYREEEKIYTTVRGEKVRSKSEVLIADMQSRLGIPYRYEAELVLDNDKAIFPDFTILHKKTRQLYYLEHFGLIDDEEYREKCFRRIDLYQKCGINVGKNLIITYESKNHPFDTIGTEQILRKIFLD